MRGGGAAPARGPTTSRLQEGTTTSNQGPVGAAATAKRIERELRELGRPERSEKERAYLESELDHLGVSVPDIRRVAKAALKGEPGMDRVALLDLVERLWAKPVHELRMAAVELLVARVSLLEATDVELVERLLRESRTWALVDNLAASVAGDLVERNAQLGKVLDRWAKDADFWIRRSALLAMLRPLRRGEGDFARFSRYADAMLEDEEIFIRKAIGWVLRERSKEKPDEVRAWLAARTDRASGLTVREGAKRLPPVQRDALVQAQRERRRAQP